MSLRPSNAVVIVALPCFGLALAACGHATLVPAPTAKLEPGASAAFSVAQGVRCSAQPDAWSGGPNSLPDFVMPVKVRVLNTSGKPIRILYEDFVLVGKGGRRYRPIPVVPIDPGAKVAPVTPTFTSWNFFVAPRVQATYRTIQAWPRPLLRDQSFYDRSYRRWGPKPPSSEMIRAALPEGVLREGGVVTGFLFFESPTDDEDEVIFGAEFDESDGPEPVASMKIPFWIE